MDADQDRLLTMHEISTLVTSLRGQVRETASTHQRLSRRWATLVILLLVLGAIGFGAVFARQESIVSDLKQQSKASCETRNANEEVLRQSWLNLARDVADLEMRRDYLDAASRVVPRDCSIFVR